MIKMVEKDEVVPTQNKEPKSTKPMMEKRRRARINESLNELKHLILEATKKDISCYSKLEKADILEMTVRHLRSLKTQQNSISNPSDPFSMAHYRAGFNECAREVSRYLGSDVRVKSKVLSHLSMYCRPQTTPDLSKAVPQRQTILLAPCHPYYQPHITSITKTKTTLETPNGVTTPIQYRIIPGQLADGKIAAVLVSNQNSQALIPQYIPVYTTGSPPVDFQPLQGFHLSTPATRQDQSDTVWRPW